MLTSWATARASCQDWSADWNQTAPPFGLSVYLALLVGHLACEQRFFILPPNGSNSEDRLPKSTGATINMHDEHWMRQALNLAIKGEGLVEPNPMVGCVLVSDDQCLGQGYHTKFGQSHAEVEALQDALGRDLSVQGCTAYVTLEPCAHHGKTPPCAQALIDAKIGRVVIATQDPFPEVAGRGIQMLQAAGISVTTGVLEEEAQQLLTPFFKRVQQQLPWMIGKWAMTLDGKIATSSGDSRWISGEAARAWVHKLRGRVDGILVGIGTALADDPQLTVRPAGLRVPARLVLDRQLRLPLDSCLVQTANEVPVIIAVGSGVSSQRIAQMEQRGVTVWQPPATTKDAPDYRRWVRGFLTHLSALGMTNILVEGGASVLGNLLDQHLIDEVAVFVAPKIVGGTGPTPIGGMGLSRMSESLPLMQLSHQVIGSDVLVRGRMAYSQADSHKIDGPKADPS